MTDPAKRLLSPFAIRLRNLRRAHGGTQAEVAEALGVSRSYLAGMETDNEKPGRETLQALSIFYGVSVSDFYTVLPPSDRPPMQPREIVEDPVELALLRLWRGLTAAESAPGLLALIQDFWMTLHRG